MWCIQKGSWLKVYLPRQKWIMNETFFFKLFLLSFTTLIILVSFFIGWSTSEIPFLIFPVSSNFTLEQRKTWWSGDYAALAQTCFTKSYWSKTYTSWFHNFLFFFPSNYHWLILILALYYISCTALHRSSFKKKFKFFYFLVTCHIMFGWVKSFAIFAYVLVSKINSRNCL